MGGDEVALMTSRYWEGAYTLKKMLEAGVPVSDVIMQKTWWRDVNGHDYSPEYMNIWKSQLDSRSRTHYTVEELVDGTDIKIHLADNISNRPEILEKLNPDLIALVGGRILKPSVTSPFKDRIINYHTGILPEYRGPYSEFWAFYNDEKDMVGTTIHLLDEGIDTGDILSQEKLDVSGYPDPQGAHEANAKAGAALMARTVLAFLDGSIKPVPQDESKARYFTFPTDGQIEELQRRLGVWFDLHYAD